MKPCRGLYRFLLCSVAAVALLFFLSYSFTSSATINTISSRWRYFVETRDTFEAQDSCNFSEALHTGVKPIHGTNLILLHNAVPKTASRTLELLIRKFNRFEDDKIKCNLIFPQEIQYDSYKINQYVLQVERGSYLRGHFPYHPITNSAINVQYVNIVRSPIERLQSHYYFDLFGDNESKSSNGKHHKPTIDECIEDDVCFTNVYAYYRGITLTTFCGHDDACTKYTRWTLDRAKQNSQKYILIGLTSEWNNTIRVLEALFPDLMRGLFTFMVEDKDEGKVIYKTVRKIPLKNKTLEFLQRDMSLEEEFYQFVKERFQRTKRLLL